jgi:hypothetical protein
MPGFFSPLAPLTRVLGLGPRRHPVLRPDPVFIIGMHRSGTSALGGALEALGLSVGKTVMPPSAEFGNPKGFYENLAVVNLHDQFCRELGPGWDWATPLPIRRKRFRSELTERYREKILVTLVEEFGSERPLIKDPRICKLLPLWRPLIKRYFPEAMFLLPIRLPLEVAASLHKRDNFTMAHGVILWAIHVLEGERGCRGFRRFFTTYEKVLLEPRQTVAELAHELGLPAAGVAAAVEKQIDPSLRHHAEIPWPENVPHRELIAAIYQALVGEGPRMKAELNPLRREYYRKMRFRD